MRRLMSKLSSQTGRKLRGLEKDSIETRISKTVSWLLRHSAEKEGLKIRGDGYVKVVDLLDHPKLKPYAIDLEGLQEMVRKNEKQRFKLQMETSPSSSEGVWLIKANQGHSIQTVEPDLKLIKSVDDIPTGIAVHGTYKKAWASISTQGLSRMKRNYIHCAQGIRGPNIISGMRNSAQVFVFVDVQKALEAGIKFFLSDNGVVLTPGDKNGFLKPEFFARVLDAEQKPLPLLRNSGPVTSVNSHEVENASDAGANKEECAGTVDDGGNSLPIEEMRSFRGEITILVVSGCIQFHSSCV